jgi:beta-phosphoglucomutase-like phosphatase (HAD superfamily)
MKICPVIAVLFHVDRQTDRRMDGQLGTTKIIVYFRNSVNVPKISYLDAAADLVVVVDKSECVVISDHHAPRH